ncbi:DMT family transporter [Rubrobacter aplysinae]|uniref:DMT family transporter n=1 Tax=Rubrobacter aplysinae TaxID=909625 RepID=UPI00064BE240|nr:DMT family transporter [Rubrobacter aplysinae]
MRLLYTLALVGVTMVWGWTFVVVQDAIAVYGLFAFLAVRFGLAAVAMSPFFRRMTRRTLAVGGGIGVVLALSYLSQTAGLLYTTPTNAGLITGLFVVFAPIMDRLLFGVRISRQIGLAIAASVLGLLFLAGGSPTEARLGDALVLLCAVALGTHIALLSRYSREFDASGLAAAQMLSVAVIFLVAWPLFEPVTLPPGEVVFALLLTGLVASAGAYYIQTSVQRHIPAARAAIVLTMEPVFAAFFGYWLAGDRLNAVQLAGAALVLSALVVGEILPVLRRERKKPSKSSKS